jgi:protein O-mannosyl-transferase
MTMSLDLKSKKTALLLVLLSTGLLYVSCLRYEFVYDDNSQIVLNPAITSTSHISEYFSNHVWANILPDAPANYYRPIFLLWLLINYKLFGLSPAGWHATNILVHLVATWLVFVLARRLTADLWIATIAAFLFGIHPVHIEAVAWISGVTDSLMTVFFLAAVVLYLDSKPATDAENQRMVSQRSLLLALLFYSLAILTKETAVVFLPLVVVYELLVGREKTNASSRNRLISILLTMLPFLIVTGIYFIIRFRVLGGLAHQLTSLPGTTVALTIPSILWFYINHLIWPLPLSAFYDNPYVSGGWLFWGPLVGLVIVATIYVVLVRRSRPLLFLACWMLVPILPLLNLTLFKFGEIVHDRYLYLPSVGLCIIMSLSLIHVIRSYVKYRTATIGVLLIVGAGWALETVIELPMWKNDLALYTHGAAVAPKNNIAINNLAATLKFSGDIDRAIAFSKLVLDRDPNNWLSLYNLGHSYYMIDAFDEATKYLGRAIDVNPRAPDQYLFYGLAAMRKGDMTEAEAAMRTAIGLRPANAKYHFALGVLLKQKGDLKGANVELARAVELDQSIEANARPLLADIEASAKPAN